MKTLQILVLLPALLMTACAVEQLPQQEEAKPLMGTINGEQLTMNAIWSDASGDNNQWRVTVTGNTGQTNEWLRLNVDLDLNALFAAPEGMPQQISGAAHFQLDDLSLDYNKAINQSDSVTRAWVEGGCTTCISSPSLSQQLSGNIILTVREPTRLAGTLRMAVTGALPGWWGVEQVQATFELPFDVAVSYIPVAPPIEEETPEEEIPVVEETPAENDPTVGNNEGSTTKKQQPNTSFPSSGKYSEVTLTADVGVDFAAGKLITKANFANSDLYATAGHQWLKLTTGGPNPVIGQPIRWFKNSSGYIKTFNNMDEMPDELPTEIDASKSLVKAKPGIGFIIKNNLSNSYTRCWIRAAGPDFVTIEYDLFTL
jgi:hypothetical protein